MSPGGKNKDSLIGGKYKASRAKGWHAAQPRSSGPSRAGRVWKGGGKTGEADVGIQLAKALDGGPVSSVPVWYSAMSQWWLKCDHSESICTLKMDDQHCLPHY